MTMDKNVQRIAEIMEHLTAEIRPVLTHLWRYLGSQPSTKVTIFISVDGHPGNMMFTNESKDPWVHQERIIREIEENKLERGKTMVEVKHFGDRPK